MKTVFRSRLLASTLLFGTIVAAAPAFAQTVPVEAAADIADPQAAETPPADIVVTGSRIGNPALEQSSPVAVISQEEIGFQQPLNAEEFLRDLPGSAPGIGSQVNNGANGSATVNLRGLGTNRNLVLLNGRRVVPATLAAVVDTNVIPVALIERVDVFTGGASTAYGADAIAGVVNFVTRRDFSGVNLSGNYGITERGDGRNYRTDILIGANLDDNKGNVVLGMGYSKTLPIYQGDRDIGLVSRSSVTGLPQGSNTATPASIFFPIAAGFFDPSTGTINTSGLSNYNFNPLNVFQTPLERYNIFGSARYEISPAIEVFTEGFFNRSSVRQIIAPSGSFTNQFRLPLNNRFLTPAQASQLCIAAAGRSATAIPGGAAGCPGAIAAGTEIDAIVARRFTEAGPRLTTYRTDTFQFTAGARGKLTSTLNWELVGQYGESSRVNESSGQGLFSRFQQAIRGCPTGSTTGCVPINIFGAEGTLTPQMFNFINAVTNVFTNTELGVVQGGISGDFGVASPFASQPIGIAIGGEYRRYGGSTRGDTASSTAGEILGAGGAAVSVSGEYDSKEVYAEINAPLVEDKPFIYNLTAEGGIRYSDYSTSGGNTTWKVGGSYSPIRDIKFRGVYTRAVRAPNINELFSPVNTVLANRTSDPCQGTLAQVNARGAGFAALCQAQLTQSGSSGVVGSIPAPIAGQINVTGGGNPDLAPEIATTITAGVVLQPSFLRGFTANADFYKIKIRDAISAPTQSDIIDGCFAQASAAFAACTGIFRNPLTGGLSGDPSTTRGPILQSSNLGRIEVMGVDFGANYRRDFGPIGTTLGFNGNYTDRSRFQATPSSINRECVRYYSASCDPVLPKWTWNGRFTVDAEDQAISLLWRHVGRTRVEPIALPAGQRPPVDVPQTAGPANILAAYQTISPKDYFDLAYRADVTDTLTFTFLVENLLDKNPPDVGNTVGSTGYNSGNTFPSMYDALGRRYRVGVNLSF